MKLSQRILLSCIIILSIFTRLLFVNRIPAGLEQDETSIGYNAYSILKTGKDEYGVKLPLFFRAFGEYKLPIYIYAAVPAVAVFGLNEFAVRLPSAFFGIFTVYIFYLLVKEMFPGRQDYMFVMFSVLLFAVNPWQIFFSRGAFEVIPALFFLVSGTYVFMRSIRKESIFGLILSLTLFILSAYTYNLCRLLAPVILVGLFLYCRDNRIVKNKRTIISVILMTVVAIVIPYVLNIGSSVKGLTGTFLFTSATNKAQLVEFKTYIWQTAPWISHLFTPLPVLYVWAYLRNILSYLSGMFFFINGPDHPNHTTGMSGLFYMFEAVTIVTGIVVMSRKYRKQWNFLLFWTISAILLAAATREAPYATRSIFAVIPLEIFSGFGLVYFIREIQSRRKKALRIFFSALVFCFLYISVIPLWMVYIYRFPVLYAHNWRLVEKDVAHYIQNNLAHYQTIIIDPASDIKYTSLLFYMQYPPDSFQRNGRRGPVNNEGFSQVISFGKIVFKNPDWTNDLKTPGTLIITGTVTQPKMIQYEHIWYYPERPVVVVSDEKILISMIREEAFLAYGKPL